MAQQGTPVDMSKLSPAEKDAMMQQVFANATTEMEYRVELFNKMVSSCHEKCIDKKYKDGDLNVGENSCVDRCTSKYWQCVGIVGQMLGA
eukprot:CAMPEP_0203000722 /NCGR_PEP_ID=MMETSP1401-20130829/96_1 /ASSEMBLY_ACC=CAM_ASM_000894 /TAXON_ID=38833 /ORGANISM="Micromonas pusilla, Strain CCAC1681" /LENGTH=89 /DNA_ID=CAMNT_0049742175 /DNA_START=19 /DNA_END=285 /DNA_ORIENTATION=+